jgi:DNA-damage-inducible protein D
MGAGVLRSLQNCSGSEEGPGGFDSYTFPPTAITLHLVSHSCYSRHKTSSLLPSERHSRFESIKRTSRSGIEYWSSRELAGALEYTDYRNFEQVVAKAKEACFNSGQPVEDHFVERTEMVAIGSGAERSIKVIYMDRFACYLAIQNADPTKTTVALGQTYFAIQTRRQELSEEADENERRLMLRNEMKEHNKSLASAA